MAMKGYCRVGDVAQFLGVTLTEAQEARVESLIEAAEADMDREMNRAFLTGTISNELHDSRRRIYLANPPVASLTSVEGRVVNDPAEAWETLVVADDYELVNATTGEVLVAAFYSYAILRVTYVPVDTVPADIREACVELVAARVQPTLNPALYGVDSVTLPDYSVRYNRAMMGGAAFPPTVADMLDRYRFWPGSG